MNAIGKIVVQEQIIRQARIEDLSSIMAILESNLIKNSVLSSDTLEQSGFLIHGFTARDAENAILDKDNYIYLVSANGARIIAYAVGSNVRELKKTVQEEFALMSSEISKIIFSEKVFYLRHIAKKSSEKGVGKKLLEELLRQAKNSGYKYMICQIAEKPIQNKASKAFHEQYDFRCVGYIDSKNPEITMGIYLKSLM